MRLAGNALGGSEREGTNYMTTQKTKAIAIRLTPQTLPLPKMMLEEKGRTVVLLAEWQAKLYPSLSDEQWYALRGGGTVDIYQMQPGEQLVVSAAGAIGVTRDQLPPIENALPSDSLRIDFLGGPTPVATAF